MFKSSSRLLSLGLVILALLATACSAPEPTFTATRPNGESSILSAAIPTSAPVKPATQVAVTGPSLSEAAQWDATIKQRFDQINDPRIGIIEFATLVNGRCLGLVPDDALADLFGARSDLTDAVKGFSDEDCEVQEATHSSFMGNGPTNADSWNETIDIRYGRAVTWGTRQQFMVRAEQMCDGTEATPVTLDPSVSTSATLELAGIENNGECDLPRDPGPAFDIVVSADGAEIVVDRDDYESEPADSSGKAIGESTATSVSGRIVFSSDRDGDYDLYAVHADGTDLAPITTNDVDEASWLMGGADVSPEGSRVAFARATAEGDTEIFVVDLDGTNEVQLTNNDAIDGYPAWDPSRTAVAVHRLTPQGEVIVVVPADGSMDEHQVTEDGLGGLFGIDARIAPFVDNGKAIAFLRYGWDPDAGKQIVINSRVGQDPIVLYGSNTLGEISVQPGGARLVFDETVERYGDEGSIFLAEIAGGEPRQLTDMPGLEVHATFSPDASMIAFIHEPPSGGSSLYVMTSGGLDLQRLVAGDAWSVNQFRWAPNSDALAFSYYSGGHQLAVVDLDGAVAELGQAGVPIGWG